MRLQFGVTEKVEHIRHALCKNVRNTEFVPQDFAAFLRVMHRWRLPEGMNCRGQKQKIGRTSGFMRFPLSFANDQRTLLKPRRFGGVLVLNLRLRHVARAVGLQGRAQKGGRPRSKLRAVSMYEDYSSEETRGLPYFQLSTRS